jgi:hypothetical protein
MPPIMDPDMTFFLEELLELGDCPVPALKYSSQESDEGLISVGSTLHLRFERCPSQAVFVHLVRRQFVQMRGSGSPEN